VVSVSEVVLIMLRFSVLIRKLLLKFVMVLVSGLYCSVIEMIMIMIRLGCLLSMLRLVVMVICSSMVMSMSSVVCMMSEVVLRNLFIVCFVLGLVWFGSCVG